MKLKKYLWKGKRWFSRGKKMICYRYLKKNNRKESGEKKRERGIEKKLTVEHQSSMNCDWRKAPHSNRVNRHRSKALRQVLSNGFTCTDLSKSWSFEEGARTEVRPPWTRAVRRSRRRLSAARIAGVLRCSTRRSHGSGSQHRLSLSERPGVIIEV